MSPRRACAGLLVQCGELRALIDCGPGIARRLAEREDGAWRDITHVLVSHFHLDHHLDLPALIYAWKYGMLPPRSAPLEIIGPPGMLALVNAVAAAHGPWVTAPGFPVVIRELPPGDATQLPGGVELSSCAVPQIGRA